MIYIKLVDYTGQQLNEDEQVLMSHAEFVAGGKDLRGVPLTITPDGAEPIIQDIEELPPMN